MDTAPPHGQGYKGFGSFFSDNVQSMIEADPWSPPACPFPLPDPPPGAPPPFGAALRPYFLVDFDAWAFVNHGAFGAPSAMAFDAAARWRRHAEAQVPARASRLCWPIRSRCRLPVPSPP